MGYEIQELFPIQQAKQPLEVIASITVNRTYRNHGNDKDNQGRSSDSPFNGRFPVSWYIRRFPNWQYTVEYFGILRRILWYRGNYWMQ